LKGKIKIEKKNRKKKKIQYLGRGPLAARGLRVCAALLPRAALSGA
jgi:hypothetical protein